MDKRRAPSLRQKLKSQIEATLSADASEGGAERLSEADLREALAARNLRTFSRFEVTGGVDLFGEPIVSNPNRMGRPPHLPTIRTRKQVSDMRAEGRTQPEIAKVIGISLPTLRLNYPNELGSSSQTWRGRASNSGERNSQ